MMMGGGKARRSRCSGVGKAMMTRLFLCVSGPDESREIGIRRISCEVESKRDW
jgi:hypothetical protein